MPRFPRAVFIALLLSSLLAGTAGAEFILPVSDNNAGVFDQPSALMDGAAARVAFIGDNSASGVFKVYYAAVNGSFNFQGITPPTDNSYLLTRAVVVDNTATDAYYDARHPGIAMRNSTQVVILFQARPTSADNAYRPYIAKLTLSGNNVTEISVRKMVFPAGVLDTVDIENISFGIVPTDNTARIAFDTKSAIGAPEKFQVYFARVGLDNSSVVGTPIQLSSIAGTDGILPLPSLRLDTLNRSHVAWASRNSLSDNTAFIYYAMIKETNGIDNRVISATPVIASGCMGFPSLMVFNNSSIFVVAADESTPGKAGDITLVNFNPDADNQDGSPVLVPNNGIFLLNPPGELVIPEPLYRPDAVMDTEGRVHMVGYGVANSTCYQLSFRTIATSPFYEILSTRSQVGLGTSEPPQTLPGDYTRGAFAYNPGGSVIAFWSGASGVKRNLDVTSAASIATVTPAKESGCSMVADPRSGERGRMAGAAFLLLPAAVLAVRRISRRRRNERGRPLA